MGNYVIYYEADNRNHRVITVRIFHGGQDVENIIGNDSP
ncbi:MAG: type II toxin-antitoxin system RelE/ParE family toxin [Ruminococcus sp.]|nr:type II toxin-antitoxin system RelE/ParE family toxin [Ruminococcus sp.]